jgi:hypothetical protein
LNPRSTGVASGLVDSKEHWVETTPRDGVGKLITSSGIHLERCGPWIKMEASRDYLCIVRIRRNKDKVIK